ncbi:MAG: Flp pilus assembly protein CpaB [Capsulimonas sp.]|uniref:Flp pilus assembly protein CpaB n=1 Tax=Capsulimonas sp. TaxID=2494211 RepID=UPI003263B145
MSTPSDKTLRLERTKLNPQGPKGRNTTLIIAVVAGSAAALLAFILLSRRPTETAPAPVAVVAPVMSSIVVASKDIPARTIITNDMVKIDNVAQTKLTGQESALPADVLGKVANVPIAAGAPIMTSAVMAKDPGLGLSYTFPAEFRAMTIALDPVSSVAGFLKPGDHVDVLSTFDAGHGQSLTRTVLQDVTLLATGQTAMQSYSAGSGGVLNSGANPATTDGTAPKAQDIPNATVIVTPKDAQTLMLAASKGKLMLTLRAAGDTLKQEIPSVRLSAVSTIPPDYGGVPAPRPQPAPYNPPVPLVAPLPGPSVATTNIIPMPSTVTVIRGSAASSVSVGP